MQRGERVLIHLDNCAEALLAWYACTWLGAVAVTTNARAVGDELAYYAEHSEAVAGITQPRFAELVARHCSGLKWLAITADDNGTPPPQPTARSHHFDALDGPPLPRHAPDPLAPCSVQYTSGTTPRPKGVLWTHANALWGAQASTPCPPGFARRATCTWTYLPLFHTNALAYSMLASLWVGGHLR